MNWNKDLENYINELEIIDSHNHFPISHEHRDRNVDFFTEYSWILMHYELYNAGLSKKKQLMLRDRSLSIMERWDMAEPYWERCRFTGYGRHLDAIVNLLYGIPEINRETVEIVDQRIKETLDQNHHERILKDTCHIKTSLVNAHWMPLEDFAREADRRYVSLVAHLDDYIYIHTRERFEAAEKNYGQPITTLKQFTDSLEKYLRRAAELGVVAYKALLAYDRSLLFERRDYADAEKSFQKMLKSFHNDQVFEGSDTVLEDYLMHYALSIIGEQKIPLQIHTGLTSGESNLLCNTNPELLNRLFIEYPDVDFVLLHIGYPYQNVLGAFGKMFPNVYIDLCWAHTLSAPALIRSLDEWLETMPYNKIIGFGGDDNFLDGTVGHRYMAYRNITTVLSNKIENGLMSEKQAFAMAKTLLYDNPAALYKLG